jgi:hypothetical protein
MRVAKKRTVTALPKPKSKRRKRGVDKPLLPSKFEVLPDGAHAVTIPVHTECFVNGSQGTSRSANFAAARAKQKQRAAVAAHLFGIGVSFRGVTLVRLAPSKGLDTGNLWNALKGVQDEIAAHLGLDDGPQSPASWDVGQERAEAYGVRVELRIERAPSRDDYEAILARIAALSKYWRATYGDRGRAWECAEDLEKTLRGAA